MNMRVVYPTSDWIRTSALTGSSERVGYEATHAGNDDPSDPWWATSGGATLTVAFGASRSVDTIALIGTNLGAGVNATLGGGLTGTLVGVRSGSGYPVDVALVLGSPVSASGFTITVAGNPESFSIGRVVAGLSTELNNFLVDFEGVPWRPQDNDEGDTGHDIRYDYGEERWRGSGEIRIASIAEQAALDAWWQSTRAGFYPTLMILETPTMIPPIFARLAMEFPRQFIGASLTRPSLSFRDCARGLEVVD